MTNYVCGFLFNSNMNYVVLIWKEKPKWQKGKLNGIGGKIESGETPYAAMCREFQEETGANATEWINFMELSGEDWRVVFFCAKSDTEFEDAATMESEEVAKIEVDRLDDFDHIDNLRWLIPMAVYRFKNPEISMSI